MVPELLGLGVLGYSDPLGLGVPDCLLGLRVLGVLGVTRREAHDVLLLWLAFGMTSGQASHYFLLKSIEGQKKVI